MSSLWSSPANKIVEDLEYDFVTKPKEDFYCPVTLDLLQEPYQTACCGKHLSREAYIRYHGKCCPLCRGPCLTATLDKYHQRNMLSHEVRCPKKAEGCKWEGEIYNLKQHLSTCQYVKESCPHWCGSMFIRLKMEEHKSQHCPLRPFTCQHCREYKATYQEVEKNHWPKCIKFPLPCPNECGEEEIERQHLKGHLEQTCPLEVIQCEFNYAGCGAQLQRRLMPAHVKENVEAHLSKTAILVQKQSDKIMKQIEQQGDKITQQGDKIKQQEDTIKKQGDKVKQQEDTIKKQADKIKQQEDQIKQQGDQQGDQIKQQGDQIKQQVKQQGDQIKQQEDMIKQQEDMIKEQGDQIKQQEDMIKEQGDQIKQQEDMIKEQGDQIKQQGDQIKQQGDQITIDLIEQKRDLIQRQNLLFILTCACIVLFFALLGYKIHM